MRKKSDDRLDVSTVMEEFQKSEASSGHRKGTFKIDAPFEKALDTILKAKPSVNRQLKKKART
jgi:hypothetical protein